MYEGIVFLEQIIVAIGKCRANAGYKFSSKMSIYFREFILSSTSVNIPIPLWEIQPQNMAENLRLPRSPRHSGRRTSSALLQTYARLFWSTTTCVSSLKITFFQCLFKVHPSFDLHQFIRRLLFSFQIVNVLRIFLLVKPEKRNLLLTVWLETEEGNPLFASFVISAKVCHLSVLTQRKIFLSPLSSVSRGRPLRGKFSMFPLRLNLRRNLLMHD